MEDIKLEGNGLVELNVYISHYSLNYSNIISIPAPLPVQIAFGDVGRDSVSSFGGWRVELSKLL